MADGNIGDKALQQQFFFSCVDKSIILNKTLTQSAGKHGCTLTDVYSYTFFMVSLPSKSGKSFSSTSKSMIC